MKKDFPYIAIYGAGTIGCYLGGCLLASNHSLVMVGRERIKKELSLSGLTITDHQGRNQHIPAEKVPYSTDPAAIAKADYILLTVKSGDTLKVAQELAHYAKPDAIVISLQNGIHNGDLLKQQLGNRVVLTGMVPFNVAHKGNGHFHCGTQGDLALESGQSAALVNCLGRAQLKVISYADMKPVQWGKLLLNLNNAINALSGLTLREQLNHSGYRAILVASINEALRILQSAGIQPAKVSKVAPSLLTKVLSLPDWVFQRISPLLLKIDSQAISSMAEDLSLHRTTEVDYLNGEIVKLANTIHAVAPVNQAIVKLVKQAEKNRLGSPQLSPGEIQQAIS